jgi:hypothetical protein
MKRNKLFKSYIYDFDKNERKLLTTFCNQAIKQMQTDSRFYADVKAFQSIINKLGNGLEDVKLTKDERTRLVLQLKENVKFLKLKMEKSWFIKKWLYKSMFNQYNNILSNYFEE